MLKSGIIVQVLDVTWPEVELGMLHSTILQYF